MKQLKIKLTYDQLQALDYILGAGFAPSFSTSKNYAEKTVIALLIDFALKKIKPHTYLSFDKTKTINLPIAVACALIYYWQNSHIVDAYQANILRSIVFNLEPKLMP